MGNLAMLSNLARGCVDDGPGLRTVIYTKGCTLHCAWCHNPQTISSQPQVMHFATSCVGCGACEKLCPACFGMQGKTARLNPSACNACGSCADLCLTDAIQFCGTRVSAKELWPVIERDIPYFRRSEGGVTVSGGECLLYPGFLQELFALCHKHRVHTAIETALNVDTDALKAVMGLTDLVIMDLKILDDQLHRQYTGATNRKILSNARLVLKQHPEVLVRVPLIPGVNDDPSSLQEIAQWVSAHRPEAKIELLRYNDTAKNRYLALKLPYRDFGSPQDKQTLDRLTTDLQKRFPNIKISHNGK